MTKTTDRVASRRSELSFGFALIPFGVRALFIWLRYVTLFLIGGGPQTEGVRFLIEAIGAWTDLLASLVFGILAIVFGIRAAAEKRRNSQRHRMAMAGIILGALNLLGIVITIAFVLLS